jgi:hypothetical protein
MTELELNSLAQTLAGSTPLSRLGHSEVLVVIAKLQALGHLPATTLPAVVAPSVA